jgi:hypothetical protein
MGQKLYKQTFRRKEVESGWKEGSCFRKEAMVERVGRILRIRPLSEKL